MKKITTKNKIIISMVLALLALALCIMGIWYTHNAKLVDKQKEALNMLEQLEGEYDKNKIVLTNTSTAEAENLAKRCNAKLRITEDGSFATLTLPEGVTVNDICSDEANREYLSKLGLDLKSEINSDGELRIPSRPNYTITDTEYNVLIPSSLKVEGSYVIAKYIEIDGTEQIITECKLNSAGRYAYKYTGTKPQFMTDKMQIIAYACDANGIESAYEVPSYTVLQYLVSKFKKAVANNDEKQVTMISDILALGAQSQIYMGHKASEAELATTLATAQGCVLTPTTFIKPSTDDVVKGWVDRTEFDYSNVNWKNYGLLLGNSTKLQLQFEATDLTGITAKVSVAGVDTGIVYNLSEVAVKDPATGRYNLTVEGIKVLAYNEEVSARFYDADGNQIGSTIYVSVNTFIAVNYDKKNAEQQAMLEKIYNYGKSVAAYAGK